MWAILFGALLIAGSDEQTTNTETVSISGARSTPEDPVVCRIIKVSGSIIKKVKDCRTESEWRKIADAHQEFWRQLGLSQR